MKDNTDYYMGVCGVVSSYKTEGKHFLFSSIRVVGTDDKENLQENYSFK